MKADYTNQTHVYYVNNAAKLVLNVQLLLIILK